VSDDLAELERIAGAIVGRLSAPERLRLLRSVAKDLRQAQSATIAAQKNPDGSGYAPRRPKKEEERGAYPVKFLYPKGADKPRLVLMKDWVKEGDKLTGFDIEKGATRSFLWKKVARWLPVEAADRNRPSGRLRRRGHIRRTAMFRKLRNGRNMKSGATDNELWVGFSGRASAIARVHQEGLEDKPAPNAKVVRYPRRELLGLTDAQRTRMLDMLVAHITAS
jgi:hypothetical protein